LSFWLHAAGGLKGNSKGAGKTKFAQWEREKKQGFAHTQQLPEFRVWSTLHQTIKFAHLEVQVQDLFQVPVHLSLPGACKR
jgi:hypothetical protein